MKGRTASLVLAVFGFMLLGTQPAHAGGTVPSGFQDTVAFAGLAEPSTLAFAPDGRVFVAEKAGVIKEFDGLDDNTATTVADLRTDVYNFWDRGLLGMVLDPLFPTRPYMYVLYTRDAEPGGNSPRWGAPDVNSDPCPNPPGPTTDGCVVTGRLAKLTITGNTMTAQTNLITDWCQQYPSHSIGDLAFGVDGKLYVSGGEGASFEFTDWGQEGNPVNPCGDPPGKAGTALTPPTSEGGALRSQDARTTADPTGLSGTILAIDPDSGAGAAGNPFAASGDANQQRIVAFGLRNPFRMTIRPGTSEPWVGDVGMNDWEEIDPVPNPTGATATNFGWPCYEGAAHQPGYDFADFDICESLYSAGTSTSPYFAYNHADKVVKGESCPVGSSSISGIAFSQPGTFPASYNGALFFADYSRNCIWVMLPGTNGLPDPTKIQTFDAGANGPVKLLVGPQGDLFYANLSGTIQRISRTTQQPPTSGDLALNKTATASSIEGAGFEAAKANDGTGATRWSSKETDNQWWQVDLGSAQQVETVKLNWEAAYGSHYLIQTSLDGTNFTQAADVTNAGPGVKTTTFTAREARYVRVTGVTRGTPWGYSFWSAEVYGPTTPPPPPSTSDLALNKSATASSIEGAGFEAAKANDGTGATRWSSKETDNQWWQVDLGIAQQVETVKLNWEAAYGSHYLIQTSLDGTNFTQAADVTNAGPGVKTTTFTAREARYVRVTGVTRGTPWGYSFWSAEVYGPTGTPTNQSPKAAVAATPSNGAAPLEVQLSAAGSTDPDDAADTLTYAWDADGDDAFDDGNQATLSFTYPPGNYTATARVSDPHGASNTASIAIQAGNTPPTATITSPSPSLTWKVGDVVNFTATATDAQETLPASAYDWDLIVNHCPSNCHQHVAQHFTGITNGSFTAPDHEYPSSLELRLIVTDSGGLTDTKAVTINPKTVVLTLNSVPPGLQVGLNTGAATAPWTKTVIQGSRNTLIAPTPQTLGGLSYTFGSWSDAGAPSHNITVDQDMTATAAYIASAAPVDKALNKTATASSIEGAAFAAAKANDGNGATRWSSSETNNQWWQVDLGKARKVDSVTLNWEAAYASRYKIQTSTDGKTFTQAAEVTITQPGLKTSAFTARDARYVRVLGVTRATPWGISLWDASVFGPAD